MDAPFPPRPARRRLVLTAEHVARTRREVPDPGEIPGFTLADAADDDRMAEEILAGRDPDQIWVFAYGSLIWNPCFDVAETRRGLLRGWHRSFCLKLDHFRGTPEQPGLMLALERGGASAGVLMRLAPETLRSGLAALIRREMPALEHRDMMRWSPVETATGRTEAMVFWAGPTGEIVTPRPPLDRVAHVLARACGHGGSGAEYLHNTVVGLEEHGIHDTRLWQLQAMVAREIDALPG
ncbi:gamma-glutamylcyclotransferase [Mesobaculum littorinae]|uniref:glutathione-specific gamma-glutamylcyclotransferase n=1 Tax=Mesobaculum littorinae TaxID=2486419 RepID=A0A438AIB2_9RHOB|nr:gamma-glutamylcyclotransferase [Mesobaculum littorinae]RVV98476.1 gamma-glutamylcyclotransferase [Mesobaculum littorinae]